MPNGLLSLRLYYFTSFAALGAYAPFFPRWLEARGVRGLAMGAVSALIPALGILGPPAIGVLADALGLRGSLLRVACAGAGLAIGGVGLAGALGVPLSFGAIFAAIFVYAIFRSPIVMLADVVALERAAAGGTSYGKVRLWGSVGFLAAALATGRAVDPASPAALPCTIAGGLLLAVLAAWSLPAKPAAPRLPIVREGRALLRAPDFALFLVTAVLGQIAHAAYDLCFSLHLRDLGAGSDRVGAAWAAGVVFEVGLMTFAERLLARFSAPSLLVFSFFGAAARWTLLATVSSLPVLLVFQPLHAVSFALWWVSSLAWIKSRAPAHALATAQGMFSASVASGSVAGMLVWGALYRRSGGSIVFGGAAIVAVVGASVAVVWSRRARLAHTRP